MESHKYSIQQVKLDVDFFSKERAYELQNKLSGLYHQQIHSTLHDFFYRTLPENLLIRKDSLVVDLGSMRYEQLENELPKRLTAALEELFLPLLSKESTAAQWIGEGFESLSPNTGDLSLMEFYLLKGTFPWQSSVDHGLTWKSILDRLYTNDRSSLASLLQRLGKQLGVRKRLAFQSSEEDMKKVIITIIPAEASTILAYKKKITEIQQDQQIIKTDAVDFGSAVSFFILTYLLLEQGSLFSQKIFIKSVLAQMAAHYNVSYRSVLSVMYESLIVIRYKTGTAGTLFALIGELEGERSTANRTSYTGSGTEVPDVLILSEKINLLQYYLYNGTLPAWSDSFSLSKEELAVHLKEVIRAIPNTVREMIFSLITTAASTADLSIERIRALVPVNGFVAFTRFLWPADADFLEEYMLLLIQSNEQGLLGTSNIESFEELLSKMLMKYLSDTGNHQLDKQHFIRFSLHYLSKHLSITLQLLSEGLLQATEKPGLKVHFQILKDFIETAVFNGIPAGSGAKAIVGSYPSIAPVLKSLTSVLNAESNEITAPATPYSTLSAVISYFLEYGILPWWAKEISSYPPETLLKNIYLQSAHEALQILKRAGLRQGSKQRFLWQFSEDLIYDIFSTLPDWQKAIVAMETSIELIESLPALSNLTQTALKHVILSAVWSSYMEQEFNAFDEDHFNFSISQSLSLPSLYGNLTIPADLQWDEITGIHEKIIFGNLDALILQQTYKEAPLATEDRQQEVISLLEYYLTWNRLPGSLPTLSPGELDNRLTEMLLLLYHENREALKRVMLSEKHSAVSRMHVHRLFLPDYKGGDHKQLSLLLDEYIEKDALQYLTEMSATGNIAEDKGLRPALDRFLEKARNGDTGEQLSLLLKSTPLTKYIALHYGEETMQWLMEKQSGSDQAFRQQSEMMRSLFLDLIVDIYDKQRLRILLNEATLFYLYGQAQPKNINNYINAVFRYLARSVYTPPKLFSILLHKIETDTYLASAHKEVVASIRHELIDQLKIQDRELSIKRKMESEELKNREAAAKAMEEKIAAEQLSQKKKEQANKKTDRVLEKGNKLYISNAGLILLHPFLSTYFTRLNLMDKGQFITPEAQARAVHLLQYLVFTSTSNPEHELALNKILCNYSLHEPLPLEIIITQEEADLSLELMKAAIQHSGKLSNSSVEGFRASFLQRDGIITETEQEWTLRIDQRGYDLILQTLPWSFGMIRFQWMDKPMIIEWI